MLTYFKKEGVRLTAAIMLFAAALLLLLLEVHLAHIVLCILATALAGASVVVSAVRGILRRDLLDEQFLMTVACIGAMVLGDFTEAAAVMIFYQIGEFFQKQAVARSRASVRSLMDIRPDEATVLREGAELRVDADDVAIGETLIVRTGERVPIDGVILQGKATLDTSALTGESLPRFVAEGDAIESGCVVADGMLRYQTVRTADASAASRILELVETATENKAKEERFITKFARVYTPIVVGLALILALIVPLFDGFRFWDYVYRALTFLVISCPCALVISVPMAFFGGIGGAASAGILYKGGHVFSATARVHTVAFDKTGTLTQGCLSVDSVRTERLSCDELLFYAACAEYGSNHPTARAIKTACSTPLTLPTSTEELVGLGVHAVVDGRHVLVGNKALMQSKNVKIYENPGQKTNGAVFVAIEGQYAGTISFTDAVKQEAQQAIVGLRRLGVSHTVMLSGDSETVARSVAQTVSIDEVHAQLLPHEKYEHLERLMNDGCVMYVGDGINDAPSLVRADVGVAMGAIGQDSAIEAADVVIMSDDLNRLPTAIRIARKTLRIAKQNIVFALTVKIAVMLLGAFGIANLWLAIFADVGVAILAILNAMRTLRVARERV